MSDYRHHPPYGNQNYPIYPSNQAPNTNAYPPQYSQQQPQGQYPAYGAPAQQPQPQPYYHPQQPPLSFGQHAQYTPLYGSARGPEYPNVSAAPQPPPPHLKYHPPVGPQDPSAPPPPPGGPPPPPGVAQQQDQFWPQQQVQVPVQNRQLTDEQARSAAASIFERFDVDKGGYLDLQEFMDAWRALHLAADYHETMECFWKCDANEDGRIGKDEFINVYVEEMRKRRY